MCLWESAETCEGMDACSRRGASRCGPGLREEFVCVGLKLVKVWVVLDVLASWHGSLNFSEGEATDEIFICPKQCCVEISKV